jgi:hypothetical protein
MEKKEREGGTRRKEEGREVRNEGMEKGDGRRRLVKDEA